jgi:hypothetical protein
MNRSTPDAAVTIDPTHNTYATLGELHLDREQDLFRDVRVGVQARSRRSRARARHVERRCRRRAAVRPTLLAARRPQAHGAMQVLAVLLTGYTPASAAASSRVSMRVSLSDCSTAVPAPSRFCYFT